MALVGFSEEVLTRGLMVVGLRGSMSERLVWIVTSICFGLMHGINGLFGQALGATVIQVVVTFGVGSAFYVSRMISGTLILPIILHAVWDFSTVGTAA